MDIWQAVILSKLRVWFLKVMSFGCFDNMFVRVCTDRVSPEIKILRFPGLESPGEGIGPGKLRKSPGILNW